MDNLTHPAAGAARLTRGLSLTRELSLTSDSHENSHSHQTHTRLEGNYGTGAERQYCTDRDGESYRPMTTRVSRITATLSICLEQTISEPCRYLGYGFLPMDGRRRAARSAGTPRGAVVIPGTIVGSRALALVPRGRPKPSSLEPGGRRSSLRPQVDTDGTRTCATRRATAASWHALARDGAVNMLYMDMGAGPGGSPQSLDIR